MVQIRPYEPADRGFLLGLASRFTIGMRPWRDQELVVTTVTKWIEVSIARRGERAEVFVAIGDAGQRLGFATVSEEAHFTGEAQAYVGELATLQSAEGTGVGRALVAACENWARHRGFRILALATGAANARALGFYRHLGFLDEDVKLVKIL